MKLAFYCNYLNHHQVLVGDEMYKLLGNKFCFVATLPRDAKELKGGKDYSSRPYCILAGESDEAHEQAMMYAQTVDVCVFGACSQEYAVHRAVHNPKGLAFEVGERWLKRGWLNVLSPILRTWWLNYQRYYRKANFYKLCSSAFAAADDERLGCYSGRHFKWGYLTEVTANAAEKQEVCSVNGSICMMWCARFITWKHPEMPLKLACKLKREGYKFHINMYGDGSLKTKIQEIIYNQNLGEYISLKGNVPNEDIQKAMYNSDIFLLTSDKQEGWGAVANEAMANRCCLVGADEIGAVPYLVRDGENGLVFRAGSVSSLHEKVKWLLDNPPMIGRLSEQGYQDMVGLWSPQNAAKSLLLLINDLQNGMEMSIKEGPCSKA